MKNLTFITAIAGILAFPGIASSQVIFTESFDNATSESNFSSTIFSFDQFNDPINVTEADTYSEFAFDYSATGGSRLTQAIGAAPNGGSSTGLLLAANLAGSNRSVINLYPILNGAGLAADPDTGLPVISGNYKLTLDFWSGVNDEGAGTTEYLELGAQGDGDGTHMSGFPGSAPDSDWFEVNIAGDASRNIVAITVEEDIIDPGTFNAVTAGGAAVADAAPQAAFTSPPYATAGVPAEGWTEAEVSHIDGVTTLTMNGVDILSISNSELSGQAGIPWFGYTDYFGSQAGGDSTKVDINNTEALTGDYNLDGSVDAADYTIWRDTVGDSVVEGEGADGNANSVIDSGDYDAWVENYGSSPTEFDPFDANFVIIDNVVVELLPASATAAAVPEPSSLLLIGLGMLASTIRKRA